MARGPSRTLNILMYHAVTAGPPPLDDWCFLPLRSFERQMAFLHRFGFNVVHLEEGVQALKDERLPPQSVAITFDDGYRDNVTIALPVLERYGFASTVFVVPGFTGTAKTLWPSRIDAAVEATRKTSVEIEGQRFSTDSRAARVRAARDLQALIKRTFPGNPNDGAEIVERACGTPVNPDFAPDHPFAVLDAAAIRETARKGLMRFGAHTMTHPLLSALDDAAVEAEIGGSVAAVAAASGQPCRTFAYPNGRYIDFDDRSLASLRANGVEMAVTTLQDGARAEDDSLLLPRWNIGRDITMPRFAAKLSGLFPFPPRRGAPVRPEVRRAP